MDSYGPDRTLIFVILALTLIGLVMVYSSSYKIAIETTRARDASFFLRNHVLRVMLGLILMYIFMKVGEGPLRDNPDQSGVCSLCFVDGSHSLCSQPLAVRDSRRHLWRRPGAQCAQYSSAPGRIGAHEAAGGTDVDQWDGSAARTDPGPAHNGSSLRHVGNG